MGTENTTLLIEAEPIPLEMGTDGTVRVGGARATLDTVVAAFGEGATAEEIVAQYPSLDLADVYAVIGTYLQQRSHIEAYLRRRQRQRVEIMERNEAQLDPYGIRNRLLARRAGQRSLMCSDRSL